MSNHYDIICVKCKKRMGGCRCMGEPRTKIDGGPCDVCRAVKTLAPAAAPLGAVEALDLEAIEARAKLATPGPWTYGEPLYGVQRFLVASLIRNHIYPATNAITHGTREVDDAAFIAHARQDVPALVAENRALRAALSSVPVVDKPEAGEPTPFEFQNIAAKMSVAECAVALGSAMRRVKHNHCHINGLRAELLEGIGEVCPKCKRGWGLHYGPCATVPVDPAPQGPSVEVGRVKSESLSPSGFEGTFLQDIANETFRERTEILVSPKSSALPADAKIGDYVFASRWSDEDPCDPWFIGHVSEIQITKNGPRYKLAESPRIWPHARKITADEGKRILATYPGLELVAQGPAPQGHGPSHPYGKESLFLPTPKGDVAIFNFKGGSEQEYVDLLREAADLTAKSLDLPPYDKFPAQGVPGVV